MSSTFSSFSDTTSQHCSRCGMPLPPNEGYCKNCGQYNQSNVPASSNKEGNQASAWGGNVQQSPSQDVGQQASGFQMNPWATSSTSQKSQQQFRSGFGPSSSSQQPFRSPESSFSSSQQSSGQLPDSSGQMSFPASSSFYNSSPSQQQFQPRSSSSAPSGSFQQSNIHQFQPASTEFAVGTTRPPTKKRGPRLGVIIGVILLALVLVGGGIGSYFFLKGQGNPTKSQAPQSTSTVAPKGKALFSDTFQNNNNGWDLTSKPQFSVKVGSGSLTLEDDNHKLFWETVPNNARFGDFSLYVDATLSKGSPANGYGVYIRGTSNATGEIASYYRFELYGDGTYAIFKGTPDSSGNIKLTVLAGYTVSSAIQKQGQVNHILITAHGSTLTFIVNGQTLRTLSDTSYMSGSISLFVSNLPDTSLGAQATFTKLGIYPPQS